MPRSSSVRSAFSVHPLTPERWNDLAQLFGQRGACGGCWCMSWRLRASEFNRGKGESNKRAFKRIVSSGSVPGLLAYRHDEPVGWCAVGPRECYPRLENSRILKRVDDQPVWSITCLFVRRDCRRAGVSVQLLKAAIKFARMNKARILEGYPNDLSGKLLPDAFVWTGLASAFRAAGFTEVLRRSRTRPIMRRQLTRIRSGKGD